MRSGAPVMDDLEELRFFRHAPIDLVDDYMRDDEGFQLEAELERERAETIPEEDEARLVALDAEYELLTDAEPYVDLTDGRLRYGGRQHNDGGSRAR